MYIIIYQDECGATTYHALRPFFSLYKIIAHQMHHFLEINVTLFELNYNIIHLFMMTMLNKNIFIMFKIKNDTVPDLF